MTRSGSPVLDSSPAWDSISTGPARARRWARPGSRERRRWIDAGDSISDSMSW